ncbi:hypothetical protein RFI_22703 [Reticulomyxa filosa]|uniref:Kelch motif family protein n=1 Tax=Reticulomyxa filosa TaxID=46433 RepID=X6MKX6_RETFI|nr:hypothetical protein RFI_22703 [Reticulomyxa filosa]|eukprot:ETO14668.1 hypothetical protein RFI_22703 [Reticulomyxa filosa]
MDLNDTNIKQNMQTRFETLPALPVSLYQSQGVSYNNEILICGGVYKRQCYSYHTLKSQYKLICSYPKNTILIGHCIVKWINPSNPNEITLLSLGGTYKHTLVMKYVSVWDNDKTNDEKKDETEIELSNPINQWLPLRDKNNKPVYIGRRQENYEGIRAVISGSNNHLLFITYPPKNIDVFNLHTFQYVKQTTLPAIDVIWRHCFLSKPWNESSTVKPNKKKHDMILFCERTGLDIEYDEDKNVFQFYKFRICSTNHNSRYGYVCMNGIVFFFGGSEGASSIIHKYSIFENRWMKFEHNLPEAYVVVLPY